MAHSTVSQLIAGSVLHFAPYNGTTVLTSAVPVSTGCDYDSTVAPWELLGTVQGSSVTPTLNEVKLTACSPGLRKLKKKVITSAEVAIGFTLGEMNSIVRQLLFIETTTGGILSGVAQLEGWLRYELFNEQNASVETRFSYGALSIDGSADFGEEFVKPKFKFEVYINSANTTTVA